MGHQENDPRETGADNILIRDALHEDIPGICATMPEAYGLMGGAPWQDPDYVAQGLASCAAGLSGRQKIKVAVTGSTVMGASFTGLALHPDGQTAHTEIGVIHGIAVQPQSRRGGAASALLTECEEYLCQEGARVMVAEVRPLAVAFFSARGYETAAGPALFVPSSVGTYVHPQSAHSTVLMWKNCRSEDTVVPKTAEQGTALAGVGGRRAE